MTCGSSRSPWRRTLHALGWAPALALLAACGDVGTQPDDPFLSTPSVLLLDAEAQGAHQGRTITCSVHYRIDLTAMGEVGPGEASVVARLSGAWSGEVSRTTLDGEGAGFSFTASAASPLEVEYREGSVVELRALGPVDPSSPFWSEIHRFVGMYETPTIASGNWLCAPLGLDGDAYRDLAGEVPGSWTITPAR